MFRLESYVTPILLSHVEKYVKNIRPQDAQVSLWEGEVAFQNLDLRLDVLENELNLPFEFLSGHVHELTINVPWTKINSEPIKITINTIEFVLKLKDTNAAPNENQQSCDNEKTKRKKKISKVEELNQNAGYMQSLVNKIIQNIQFDCHNIILKYVEDDIVVSMNVQLLNVTSADQNWNSSFIDPNPLRKVIKISDLTICLDKRNQMGQIEVCQEPILYRCSLEMRLERKLNTNKTKSTTTINVLTKLLELNISSLQFPMAMRLLNLILALKSGKVKCAEIDVENSETNEVIESDLNESYLSWAWNLIPSFGMEEPDAATKLETENKTNFLLFGIYIGKLKLTLKSSEFITESIVGTTKKIKYEPILRVVISEIFTETLLASDIDWSNTKFGFSRILVEPLGKCNIYCSSAQFLVQNHVTESESYLNHSLFDPLRQQNNFAINVESHFLQNSKKYLCSRGKCFVIDMIKCKEIVQCNSSEKLEGKQAVRAYLNGVIFRYNASLLKLIDSIKELIAKYDYPPYGATIKPITNSNPVQSKNDEPNKSIIMYDFCGDTIMFEIYFNKPFASVQQNFVRYSYFMINFETVECKWDLPIDDDENICKYYQDTKQNLYNNYEITFKIVSLYLMDNFDKCQLITITNSCLKLSQIHEKSLEGSSHSLNGPKLKCDFNISKILINFTKAQLAMCNYLLHSNLKSDKIIPSSEKLCSTKANLLNKDILKMQIELTNFFIKFNQFEEIFCCCGSLKSMDSYLHEQQIENPKKNFVFNGGNTNHNWIMWSFQMPNKVSETFLPQFTIKINSYVFQLDAHLVKFLSNIEKYIKPDEAVMDKKSVKLFTKGVRTVVNMNKAMDNDVDEDSARSTFDRKDTNKPTSDYTAKAPIDSNKDIISEEEKSDSEKLKLLKSLMFKIEIDSGSFVIPGENDDFELIELLKNPEKITKIIIPKIDFKTAIAPDFGSKNNCYPINIRNTDNLQTFPWSCSISELQMYCIIDRKKELLLHPIQTRITIALAFKKDKLSFQKENSALQLNSTKDTSDVFEQTPRKITTEKNTKHLDVLDNVALNLHIDTSAISIQLTKESARYAETSLSLISLTASLLTNPANQKNTSAVHNVDKIKVFSEKNAEYPPSLLEFLEIEANSGAAALTSDVSISPPKKLKLSIWCQWTITKFNINLCIKEKKTSKLTFELEDLIASIDKDIDYVKIKSKIGTINLKLYEMNSGKEDNWVVNDNVKIKMLTETEESPFLDVVITLAETDSFFKKLGICMKDDINGKLTEIIASLEAIEILVNFSNINKFMPIVKALRKHHKPESSLIQTKSSRPLIASNLPLIYFDSKGITIYSSVRNNSNLCDVCILKIEFIKLSPNLKNPLTRNPLRQEIYDKAAQLGILYTPGSVIEDRQYELIIQNISMATARWTDILNHMKEQNYDIHSTNPAVEWNNKNEKNNSLELQEIFNKVMISITFAPHIVYNNVLISGQLLEFNCVNDLDAKLTITQLELFKCLVSDCNKICCDFYDKVNLENSCVKEIANKTDKSSDTKNLNLSDSSCKTNEVKPNLVNLSTQASVEQFKPIDKSDSGISTDRIKKLNVPSISDIEQNLPSEISFVAGIFVFKLYSDNNEKSKKKSDNENKKIIIPLIEFKINQPNLLFSQNIFNSFMQISLFDFVIKLNEKPDADFSLKIFNSKLGNVSLSGIPPPLLSIRVNLNKIKRKDIELCIGKSIYLNISNIVLEKLTNIYSTLYFFINSSNPIPKTNETIIHLEYEPIERKQNKIKLIKKMLLNSDRFQLKSNKIAVHLFNSDQYDIKFVLMEIKLAINFLERPEKINAIFQLNSFYVQTESKIFIHPISSSCFLDLIQETWHPLPIVITNFNINVAQIDLGIKNIENFSNALKTLTNISENINKITNEIDEECQLLELLNSPKDNFTLESYILPAPVKSNITVSEANKEEFYQDDLRAGAFQFIEVDHEFDLPLPYQIQIITKNFGIICWRYPQPRKITNMQIFPIPMPYSNSPLIQCKMEYYSESQMNFIHFCDFHLSETDEIKVQLPKHNITATIWRVLILQAFVSVNKDCFHSDEDDLEKPRLTGINDYFLGKKCEEDLKLHPKILVGSIRIDTVFNPSIICKVEFVLSVHSIQINFQNHQEALNELPDILKNYRLANNDCAQNETFLTVNFQNIRTHLMYIDKNDYSLTFNIQFNALCLDYSYLNMTYLIENGLLNLLFKFKKKEYNLKLILKSLKFNISPGILHSILTSINHWNEVLTNEIKRYPIFSRFMFANTMQTEIVFGQNGTKERINLQPLEFINYAFKNEIKEQKIVFYTSKEHFTEPIRIEIPEETDFLTQHLKICDKILIIETKKVSSSQIVVFIKGQIEILSMVSDPFYLQFKSSNDDGVKASCGDFYLSPKGHISFDSKIYDTTEISFRLKFAYVENKGWTGDIPLKLNKNLPWLVKIPNSTKGKEFTSYWIRVVREDIPFIKTAFPRERILIIIWPIFEIKSNFIIPLHPVDKTIPTIEPKGEITPLKLSATHQTEHEIKFVEQLQSVHDEDKQNTVLLSLKTLDWNTFFWYDDQKWNISKMLNELKQEKPKLWPYNNEDELLIDREFQNNYITAPYYKCYPSRDLSCTLMLEISPWCTIINSLETRIRIKNVMTHEILIIDPNKISMIFIIQNGFQIEIETDDEDEWTTSYPIYFDSQEIKSLNSQKYICSDNTQTEIVIRNLDACYRILLENINENGRKLLKIKPVYVLCNYTKQNYQLIPFCIKEEYTTFGDEILELMKSTFFNLPKQSKENKGTGIPLSYFKDIKRPQRLSVSYTSYLFYLVLCKGLEMSTPIPLNEPFNRLSTSIQMNCDSIPLCINILEKNQQKFVNIFEDHSSTFLITNRTDLNLYVAQVKDYSQNKNEYYETEFSVNPDLDSENLEWYQMLRSHSSVYYTPPDLDKHFPDTPLVSYNLSMALINVNGDNSGISKSDTRWSEPICINEVSEKIINIPLYGEVKILICDKHKCIKITIFYISHSNEFCVKDLRSRLFDPNCSNEPGYNNEIACNKTKLINITLPKICPNTPNSLLCQCPTWVMKYPINLNILVEESSVHILKELKHKNCIRNAICSVYLENVLFIFSEKSRIVNLYLTNLQIDNRLYSTGNYDFPVILCPQEIKDFNLNINSIYNLTHNVVKKIEKPLIKLTITFFDHELKLSSVQCKLNPIRVYIEDVYLSDLFDFLLECIPNNVIMDLKHYEIKDEFPPNCILIPKDITRQAKYLSQPLKLNFIQIEPMNIMISVHTSVHLYLALDHSPLEFSTYESRNIFTLPLRFGQTMGMHYLSGALFGAGWVVGSLEILGSPSGLARSFSVGLRDFVALPFHGLFQGPWGFLIGITQGSASLLKNITAGTLNSVTKLAASVARNIDRLSFDDEHFQRTEILRRSRPQGFTQGFSRGLTGFGISILGAVGGIARHTLEAQSAVEIVTGIGRGIAGIVTKPISGAAELVALTGQGVLYTVGFNTLPTQKYPYTKEITPFMPAAKRVFNLLPDILSSDQILFFEEATLLTPFSQLIKIKVCMTSAVLCGMEVNKDELAFILPIDKIIGEVDKSDHTLFHVDVHQSKNKEEELARNFTKKRIMDFLKSANRGPTDENMTWDSLENLLKSKQKAANKLGWSFYLEEHAGNHLLQYIKIIQSKS